MLSNAKSKSAKTNNHKHTKRLFRKDNLFVLALHCLTIECRGDIVSALEEFDKVRDIGKGAVGAYLGDCFGGGEQKHLCSFEALSDKPLMRRGVELAIELLFERCE